MMKNNSTLLISLHLGILVLYIGMYGVMLAQIDPHPAGTMGPIILSIISLGVVSFIQLFYNNPNKNIFIIIFLIVSLIGIGPHKYFFDPNGKDVLPILLFGNTYLILYIYIFIKDIVHKR